MLREILGLKVSWVIQEFKVIQVLREILVLKEILVILVLRA